MQGVLPAGVTLDPATGAMTPATGHYEKRLSDLRGFFHDETARARAEAETGDALVYEVTEYRQDGSDLFFGTTTIRPGQVGGEYHMTRGHFHARPDRGEVYATLSGEGLLLLETREGKTATVGMIPGSIAHIPPGWAHRSVNTGAAPLVFSYVCNTDAGNDYGPIAERGMRKLVVACEGAPSVIDRSERIP